MYISKEVRHDYIKYFYRTGYWVRDVERGCQFNDIQSPKKTGLPGKFPSPETSGAEICF